jgi:hypothetical protein
MDQIEEYDPPPNPAKTTDSRFEEYARTYGDESWELDALDPATLRALVEDEIRDLIEDGAAWSEAIGAEKDGRSTLRRAAGEWETIVLALPEETDDDEDEDEGTDS